MFTSRHVKHSRLLLRHARKYLRYKEDRLSTSDREEILAGMKSLREALRDKDRERIHSAADTLDKTLHRLTPVTWESHWRENCEVILVAIVVAVGIRSYFLQPFKIPTGSMQPSLNGIIGHPTTARAPNFLQQIGEFIARGSVDTGDQVFVDKCSYNFVKPHRGDVFVFRTKHIFGIREDPQAGSPFYIKRLAGLPGDTLRIDPPLLYINGKIAQGFGFARVMSTKPPYRGYALGRDYLAQPKSSFTVPEHKYFALGDNSYNSYDSRYWGPVPDENLVGRGLFVYWPFDEHWGLIR